MATCFVIQPFDEGKFDKRYAQTLVPAIQDAGLEAYRVDQDIRVEVPIEAIEAGIRDASVCLADITTDNPNVWYELGYAMALGKPVAMICSTERQGKYPFDIQHRTVIRYQVDASDDFLQLQIKLTAKLNALSEKVSTLRQIASADPVAPLAGLSSAELTVLATIAGTVDEPDSWAATYRVKQEAERDYLTPLGFSLALRRLLQKGFAESGSDYDYNGNEFNAVRLTHSGWRWIDDNESRFVIRKEQSRPKNLGPHIGEILDEDIPF